MPTLAVQLIGLLVLLAGIGAGYWITIRPRVHELSFQARGLLLLLILTMMGGFIGSTGWWFDVPEAFSWDLPPLASRMLGAAAVAFGYLNFEALRNPTRERIRLALLMLFVYLTPLAVAIILFHMDRFDPDAPITYAFFVIVFSMIILCGWYFLRQPQIIPASSPTPPLLLTRTWLMLVTGVMALWGAALFLTDSGSALIWAWQGDLMTTRLVAVMLLAIATGAFYSLRSADVARVMLNLIVIYGVGIVIANFIQFMGDKPVKTVYVGVFGVMAFISALLAWWKPSASVTRLFLIVMLLSLSPNVLAKEDEAEEPTGRIVFDHEHDIYVMNADGSERTRLTTDPDMDFDAVWSPDGTRIAFRSHRDGNEEVYVMNADGSEQTNLTNNPDSDYSPAWSPDGTRIAFASNRTGRSGNDIWLMDADGSNPVQITDIPGISEYPTWSPDGTQIAFACTFGKRLPQGVGDFEICVMNADGSNLIQITDEPGQSKLPAWSPDGKWIAFASDRHGWPSLPDYVPSGYDERDFGEFDIYLMHPDGSHQVNITNNPREGEEMAAWSPDGWLIFSRYGCLMVMHPDYDDIEPVQLTPNRLCADGFPDW